MGSGRLAECAWVVVGMLGVLNCGGCLARSTIDPDRNEMAVGVRERRGEEQIHWLLRERTEIYRHPELIVRYAERMEERLSPSPISGEPVLGQVRESADAWERFFAGTR